MQALVFDIEKFAVHDGPGIRTAVFLKGCPLHCLWCHNPESQSFEPEISFISGKCSGCGACASVCPRKCHGIEDGIHVFRRESCVRCGMCAEQCPAGALETVGRLMSVEEVMKHVLTDKVFYENSGGGVTLTGGEPLAHFNFIRALLEACRQAGLHTCVETCGYAEEDRIRALLPLVDLWLWDVKATSELHRKLTGVDIGRILDNLRMIDKAGARMWLRCPMIEGVNDSDEHLGQIAELANELKGCQRIDIEPYHPLGESKASRMGYAGGFHSEFIGKEKVDEYEKKLKALTNVQIYRP